MSFNISVTYADEIKYKEIAYAMILKMENLTGEHFFSKQLFQAYFSDISAKDFYDCLITSNLIEEDFIKYIKEEYGEPWVSGYPLDLEVFKEAICYWSNISESEFFDIINILFASMAIEDNDFRINLCSMFDSITYYKDSTKEVNINPIPKELRDINLKKGNQQLKKISVSDSSYNLVIESLEAIYDLSNDDIIKQQVDNIRDVLEPKSLVATK